MWARTRGGGSRTAPSGDRLWSVDLAQRTGLVREIACAQHLRAGVVLTVERRDCARAAWLAAASVGELNHRPRWYICTGLKAGFWAASGKGGLLNTTGAGADIWRHGKGLDAEASDERTVGVTVAIGFQVTLVPGDSKWRIGHLNDKEVEVRIRWQVVRRNHHDLDWTLRLDGDVGVCTFKAVGADCGTGTDHVELGLCYCWRRRRCRQFRRLRHPQRRETPRPLPR